MGTWQLVIGEDIHPRNMKAIIACSLLLVALPMLAAWELSLLHVNDIHARMEETNKHSSPCTPKDRDAGKCFGGLARIVTAVKRVQNEDQLFGSTVETSSRERSGTQSSNGEWSLR